ncbi:type II toxin-antitoxin system VapC family toxin [Planktothrix sp. FACHB-1365]|uniref:type II toxin-antitoxin system VapC family toxin n=1 Tax=Planktothrix sp. FACHB-1365 TaxID=2692855 RepID=UPI0016893262|nr:type II toxin-antitoxin system VapC family toxin [Planktothrix sp. FACHB-1365]
MSLWVLDTDHITLFENQHPLVIERVMATDPDEITVTIITVEEQMKGWLNAIQQSSQSNRLIWGYKGLQDGLKFFQTIQVLDFDQDAYNCYIELVRQKIRIGTRDLRIAATVISKNGILVTRNRQDFERVPGLRFEDWSKD